MKSIHVLLLTFALCLGATGCGASPEKKEAMRQSEFVAEAEAEVARALIDPASAQFAELRLASANGRDVLCGNVNGKNRLGGYAGFTAFTAIKEASAGIRVSLANHPVGHAQALPCMPLTDPASQKDPLAAVDNNYLLFNACLKKVLPDLTFWRSAQEVCAATLPYDAED